MRKSKLATEFILAGISFCVFIFVIFLYLSPLLAQKEEKSLQKVLEAKNQKKIYEIRALKIKTISERLFNGDGTGNVDSIYDKEEINRYDAAGNLIENEIIIYNESLKRHVPVQKWVSRQNDAGLPELETLYYYNEKKGSYYESKKWAYEYDGNQNLTSLTVTDPQTGLIIEKTLNKYDEKNNKIETIKYHGHSLTSTTFYKYDKNKNELESLTIAAGGGVIEKICSSYDEAGIKIETAIYKNGDNSLKSKIMFNKLACPTVIETYSAGSLLNTILNTYDNSGNKTEETKITAGGQKLYFETYIYDQLNNLIDKTRYNKNNLKERKEIFKYDELNLKIEELYFNGSPLGELIFEKRINNKYNDLRKIQEMKVFNKMDQVIYKIIYSYEYNQ